MFVLFIYKIYVVVIYWKPRQGTYNMCFCEEIRDILTWLHPSYGEGDI